MNRNSLGFDTCKCPKFVPDWNENTCAICKLRKPQAKAASLTSLSSSQGLAPQTYSTNNYSTQTSYSQQYNRTNSNYYSQPQYTQEIQQQPLTHRLLNPSTAHTPIPTPIPTPISAPISTPAPAPLSTARPTQRRRVAKAKKPSDGGFFSSIFGKFKTQPSHADPINTTPMNVAKYDHHEELDKIIFELNNSLVAIGKKPLTLEEKMELKLGLKNMASNPEALRAITNQLLQASKNFQPTPYVNRSSLSTSQSNSTPLYSSPSIATPATAYSSFSNSDNTRPIIRKKSTIDIEKLYSSIDSPSYNEESAMYKVKDPFETNYSNFTTVQSDYKTSDRSSNSQYRSESYTNKKNDFDDDDMDPQTKIKKLQQELEKERTIKKNLEVEIFNLNYKNGNISAPTTSSGSSSNLGYIEVFQKEIQELKRQLSEKTSECQRLAMKTFQSADSNNDQVKQLEKMFNSKNEELQNAMKSFSNLQRENQQLRAQMNGFNDNSAQLEKQKQYQNEMESKLRQQILTLENKIVDLESTIANERHEKMSLNLQIENLQQENDHLTKKITKLNERENSLPKVESQNNKEIFQLQDTIRQKDIEIQELRLKYNEIEIQQVETAELTVKLEVKNKLINEGNERTIESLQAQIEKLNIEKKNYLNAKSGLETTIELLTEVNNALKAQINTFHSQKGAKSHSRSSSSINNNNNNNNNVNVNNELARELQILKDKISKYDKEIIRLNVQLKEQQNQKQLVEDENNKLNQNFQQLRVLVSQVENEREKLNQKIQTRKDQIDLLTRQYNDRINALEAQIATSGTREISHLNNQQFDAKPDTETEDRLNTLNAQNQTLQRQIQQLQIQIKDQQEVIRQHNQLQNELHHVKQQLETSQGLLRDLREENQNLLEAQRLQREQDLQRQSELHFELPSFAPPTPPTLTPPSPPLIPHRDHSPQSIPSKTEEFDLPQSPPPLPPSIPPPPPPPPMNTSAPPPPPPPTTNLNTRSFEQPINMMDQIKGGRERLAEVPVEVKAPSEGRSQLLDQIRSGVLLRSTKENTPTEEEKANASFDPDNILHVLLRAMLTRRDNIENEGEEEEDEYYDEDYDEESFEE